MPRQPLSVISLTMAPGGVETSVVRNATFLEYTNVYEFSLVRIHEGPTIIKVKQDDLVRAESTYTANGLNNKQRSEKVLGASQFTPPLNRFLTRIPLPSLHTQYC